MPLSGLQFHSVAADDEKNLDDLTVAELRERASELEITGRSTMNKADLVQAVEDADAQIAQMNGDDDADSDSDSDADGSDTEDRPWRDSSGGQ